MGGLSGLLVAGFLTAFAAVGQAPATWDQGVSIPGVFDVSGPRADGRVVVAAAGRLYLLDAHAGTVQRFADGPGGYQGVNGDESYIAVSPGAPGPGCSFARDDVFVLRLRPAGGILRVDQAGVAHDFATVDGVDSLNGITFDTVGAFGHRLLVTGPHANHSTVAAIDCSGNVTIITRQTPVGEGGIAVAPAGFGAFGGDLILPDELSGAVYAIAPGGDSRLLSRPALPTGGDTGVEGVGFLPKAPVAGQSIYFADRYTSGNAHPGTDHLLVLGGDRLARAGARPGDLLVATEGGAGLVGVRCSASCDWYPIIPDNPISHGEGHVLVVPGPPGPAFTALPPEVRRAATSAPVAVIAAAVAAALLALTAGAALVLRRRR